MDVFLSAMLPTMGFHIIPLMVSRAPIVGSLTAGQSVASVPPRFLPLSVGSHTFTITGVWSI